MKSGTKIGDSALAGSSGQVLITNTKRINVHEHERDQHHPEALITRSLSKYHCDRDDDSERHSEPSKVCKADDGKAHERDDHCFQGDEGVSAV